MAIQRTKAQVPDSVEPSGLDEFKPRERVTKEVSDLHSFIKPGWAVGKNSSSSGEKANVFKIEKFEEEILIKFLEESAFAPIFQHWVNKRPYTCITPANDCPLCARGDKPKSCDYINVVDMSGDEPELKLWYASPSPAGAIKQRAENKRTSPINKSGLYFVAYKVNTKNDIPEYHLDPVREDELNDWGATPLTDEQIEKFNADKYTVSAVKIYTKAELQSVVDQNFTD